MFWYQYLIVLVLFLYWYKASSKGAFIILCGYALYFDLIYFDISAESYIYYYSCASLINLIVGYFLQKVNRLAALCSYSLVIVNIYGAYLWYTYSPPDIYDNISLIILTIQLIIITPRGLLDGLKYNRAFRKHTVAKSSGFDSFQSHVTMYKIQTNKKAKK